ncbi:ABC transporter substrate-binding protein [Rhodovastum atsumiense]|uniref:ABC transporter substrate-binding protein n=1 Tax=Rhodovastum atsumiense TaxID=504468 RepID=A0A5M6J3K5_9PROT|nr:ABC transporter substrate-binding protein [Rhodovastum atsumiense]KAA5614188.1 ABC transporter substrate-binding protein [Rhodovastum atsumiense]CAH2599047.1 ABC transporter substrate-binding protein [Rhodovastum atsumiense]
MQFRIVILCLAAAVATAPAQAVTFKWANDGDVRVMDPYTLDETVQNSFLANIYEPLVRRDRKLGLEPALAEKWEQTAPTVWRFHLRPGVTWQDGTKFTADDVVFSYGRITGKTASTGTAVASVKGISKVDDLTVDFETKLPDPILPSSFTNFLILPKAWMEKNGAAEVAIVGTTENFAHRNAMGTGPFRLALREPDRRTVLERNPTWWDKPWHNLDRVEYTVISSAATRVAALLSGEIDMVYAVPPQDIDRISRSKDVRLIQGPELRTVFLSFDQVRDELQFSSVKGKNPFKDQRVREAFALAIDEQAIATRVMRGQGRPTWMMWGPGVNGYDAALDKRPAVDLARAKALLAEAGYPEGFQVTLDCPNDRYIADEAICTAIAGMLARINVKVDVFARTKVRYFGDIGYPKYNTSFYMLGWTPNTYDAANPIRALLATRGRPGLGVNNSGGYSNKRIDELEPLIATELDPAKRQAMISEVARIVQTEVGYIPLHQQRITWAAKNNIELTQPADNYFPLRWVRVK